MELCIAAETRAEVYAAHRMGLPRWGFVSIGCEKTRSGSIVGCFTMDSIPLLSCSWLREGTLPGAGRAAEAERVGRTVSLPASGAALEELQREAHQPPSGSF